MKDKRKLTILIQMRKRLIVDSHVKFVSVLHDLTRVFVNTKIEIKSSLVTKTNQEERAYLRIILVELLTVLENLFLARKMTVE